MAISDKITSMTNHLTADYDAIESVVGEVTVNKNIENIAPLINNLYEELPKVTASGTELTINDTRAGKMEVQLMGNTSQTQKTGKNLLNIQTSSSSQFGITVTKNSDGTLTVNGTATADAAVIFNTAVTLPAGTYTLSGCPSGGSFNTYNLNLDQLSTMRDNGSGVTFTLNSERTSTAYVSVKSGVTMNNVIFKPMIVSGSTSGDFEPYTGKKATPNPDNPEQVHTCSGDNEVVVCGKNLFDGEIELGSIDVNGGALVVNNARVRSKNFIKVKPNTRYYYKRTTGDIRWVVGYKNDKTGISDGGYGTQSGLISTRDLNFYFDTSSTTEYIKWYDTADTDLTEKVIVSTSDIPYEPYQSSTYPVNLPVENILNNTATSTTLANVIITVNTDKSITLNGTANAGGNLKVGEVNFESGETYTISGVTGFTDSTLQLYTASTTAFPTGSRLQSYNGAVTRTAQATENCDIKLYVYSGVTYNNVTIYPQIEKGTKANSYTPYGTTPIKMRGIGTYEDYFVRNSGKNLFNENYYNNSSLYGGGNRYFTAVKMPDSFKTKFYGNMTLKGTSQNLVFAFSTINYGSSNERMLDNGTLNANIEYDFTNAENVYLVIGNSNNVDIVTDIPKIFNNYNIMISKTSGEPYEPYGTGQWCKYNAIERVTLTSSQFNEKGTTGTNAYYISTTIANGLNDNSVASSMSNKFGMVAFNNRQNGLDVTYVQNGRLYIRTKNNTSLDWSTNQNCKDWLDANSPIMDYILASPYLSLIESETLINQLDAIEKALGKDGQTNISQVNNDAPFKIYASALMKISGE